MSTFRIGLFSQGDERWIAGVIYLQNLIRACSLLSEGERPEFRFLFPHKTETAAWRELGELLPPEHPYSHRKALTKCDQLRAALRSLRDGRWPASLESLASRTRLSALFPVQWSLGERFPVPWIGWVPDFQHKRLPQFFSDREFARRDQAFSRVINESSHLVVSSQDSYNDLMRWFPIDEKRVSILRFHTLIDPQWLEAVAEQTSTKYQLPRKYLMFPSQFWAHKNHETLLRALSILKRNGAKDVALAFTGFQNDYRKPGHFAKIEALIEELGLQPNIHFLGLLPRHNQVQLMRQAAAIVQPSYFEGWSSLVEDCRCLGKPLYLSDIPIHREQDPPNANFFAPDSPEELAARLERDWEILRPGPDLASEARAAVESRERGIRYARNFLSVVAKVAR